MDSIRSFHHYLFEKKFLIRTDHVSLRWLLSFKELEGQLARWLERLEQYDFEILYRKGNFHLNADGLSRCPCEKNPCKYCTKVKKVKDVERLEKIGRIILGEEVFNK